MLGFITKHFICDFPLQGKFQWSNKHIFGHPGGLLHSLIHVIGTTVVLFSLPISTHLMVGLALLDGVIHYIIDYVKMNTNIRYGWKADTHAQFWIAVGLDQYLHYLTYLIILTILI